MEESAILKSFDCSACLGNRTRDRLLPGKPAASFSGPAFFRGKTQLGLQSVDVHTGVSVLNVKMGIGEQPDHLGAGKQGCRPGTI